MVGTSLTPPSSCSCCILGVVALGGLAGTSVFSGVAVGWWSVLGSLKNLFPARLTLGSLTLGNSLSTFGWSCSTSKSVYAVIII